MNSGVLNQQRGVVLIVALIILLLMSFVGLASIRGTGLQELMAGNMRDTNVAFQAAEQALRDGETIAQSSPVVATRAANSGLLSYWQNSALNWNGVNYIIEQYEAEEDLGGRDISSDRVPDPITFYRITSRGFGLSGNSIVYLQSIYRP